MTRTHKPLISFILALTAILLVLPLHATAQYFKPLFTVRSYGGKCLDFGPPPQVTGAPVFIYDCNGTIAQQIRVVEPDTSAAGQHKVLLFAGTKVIGVRKNSFLIGTPLELQDQNGSSGQMFQLDGDSIILVANRNLVVEVQNNRGANRTPLVLGIRDLKDAEFWTFSAVDRSLRYPTAGFTVLPASTTKAQLMNVITSATFGSVIILDPGIDLTFTDQDVLPITVPAGVTIRSNRRLTDLGARLTAKQVTKNPDNLPPLMLDLRQDYTRITGMRLTGPSLTVVQTGTWQVVGILADDSHPSIVDHNELSGWTDTAAGSGNIAPASHPPPQVRQATVQIVRNFIHHNEMDNLGYGAGSGKGAFPLIEGNTFLLNRHAITGDGSPYTGYQALFNLVLNAVPGYARKVFTEREQDFDMHGTGPAVPACYGDGHCGGAAGEYMVIQGNTFLGTALVWTTHLSYYLRGTPSYKAQFFDNIVRQKQGEAIKNVGDPSKLLITNNHFSAGNPTTRLGVGDFDGDGKDDLFLATGAAWYYSSSGKVEWRFLNARTEAVRDLLFGDFDGDGRTDIFKVQDGSWFVSWGGASSWEKINSSTAQLSDLAVGDFDHDGRSDIFYSDGHNWSVSSGGTGPLTHYQTSSFRVSNLRFGDFNRDGATDVFGVVSGAWQVSYGARSSWTRLRSELTDSVSNLVIADFDGDGKPDVGQFQLSPAGTISLRVSSGGTGNWTAFSTFPGLAAYGRFQTHNRADVLTWDQDYLDVLPGGKNPSVRHNPENMR